MAIYGDLCICQSLCILCPYIEILDDIIIAVSVCLCPFYPLSDIFVFCLFPFVPMSQLIPSDIPKYGVVCYAMGGSGSEWQADWLNGNHKVASSIPGSPRVTVKVSLSKTLNTLNSSRCAGWSLAWFPPPLVYECVWMGECDALCEAPWI